MIIEILICLMVFFICWALTELYDILKACYSVLKDSYDLKLEAEKNVEIRHKELIQRLNRLIDLSDIHITGGR